MDCINCKDVRMAVASGRMLAGVAKDTEKLYCPRCGLVEYQDVAKVVKAASVAKKAAKPSSTGNKTKGGFKKAVQKAVKKSKGGSK